MKNLIDEAFLVATYRNIELLTASDNDYDFHVILISSSKLEGWKLWRDIEILYLIFYSYRHENYFLYIYTFQ